MEIPSLVYRGALCVRSTESSSWATALLVEVLLCPLGRWSQAVTATPREGQAQLAAGFQLVSAEKGPSVRVSVGMTRRFRQQPVCLHSSQNQICWCVALNKNAPGFDSGNMEDRRFLQSDVL